MAQAILVLALNLTLAAQPMGATAEVPAPATAAPAGTPETKYCMRIEANTGSRIEKVQCWTRDQWAEQGVDVDKDWAKEGIRTIA